MKKGILCFFFVFLRNGCEEENRKINVIVEILMVWNKKCEIIIFEE